MMNNFPSRKWAMFSLPVDHRAQAPSVRLGHLHPSARPAVLVVPLRHCADRKFVPRNTARLELAAGRKVHPLGVSLAPGLLAKRAGTGRREHLRSVLFQPDLVRISKTDPRAELRPALVRCFVSKGFAAVLAKFFHRSSVTFGGLFTVPLRALAAGRRGRSVELNTGYFLDGVKYLEAQERQQDMPSLFDLEPVAS